MNKSPKGSIKTVAFQIPVNVSTFWNAQYDRRDYPFFVPWKRPGQFIYNSTFKNVSAESSETHLTLKKEKHSKLESANLDLH